MHPPESRLSAITRRSFLGLTGLGIGPIAARSLPAAEDSFPATAPHFAPRAKRVTFRFQGLNHKPTGVEPAHVVHGVLA